MFSKFDKNSDSYRKYLIFVPYGNKKRGRVDKLRGTTPKYIDYVIQQMGYDDAEYSIRITSGILGNGKRKCE